MLKNYYFSTETGKYYETREEAEKAEEATSGKKKDLEECRKAYNDYTELVKKNRAEEKKKLEEAIELEDKYIKKYKISTDGLDLFKLLFL